MLTRSAKFVTSQEIKKTTATAVVFVFICCSVFVYGNRTIEINLWDNV